MTSSSHAASGKHLWENESEKGKQRHGIILKSSIYWGITYIQCSPPFLTYSSLGFDKGAWLCKIKNISVTPNVPLPLASAPSDLFSSSVVLLLLGCHVNGIVQSVTFWIWLLSFNTVHLRFIHAVGCITNLFLLMAILLQCMNIYIHT